MALVALLDTMFRQPALPVIEVGAGRTEHEAAYEHLRAIEITTAREEAGAGKITFDIRRGEDGIWTVLDEDIFTPWAPLRISAHFGMHREEIIRGYVKQANASFPPSGGEATLEVDLQDDTLVLDREHRREVWGKDTPMTDRQIIEALLTSAPLTLSLDSHDGQSARSVNQDGTAIKFIVERAKANGFEMLVQEGELYFGPMRLTGEAQAPIMVYAGQGSNCLSIEVVEEALKPNAVRFDRAADEGDQNETQTMTPDQPALGTRRVSEEGADLPEYTWRMSRESNGPAEEMEARAQTLANQNEMKIRATGELDGSLYGHVLKPGRLVTVDGIGTRNGGLYYVDKVAHRFGEEGYRQTFELIRNATGEMAGGGGPLQAAGSAIQSLF